MVDVLAQMSRFRGNPRLWGTPLDIKRLDVGGLLGKGAPSCAQGDASRLYARHAIVGRVGHGVWGDPRIKTRVDPQGYSQPLVERETSDGASHSVAAPRFRRHTVWIVPGSCQEDRLHEGPGRADARCLLGGSVETRRSTGTCQHVQRSIGQRRLETHVKRHLGQAFWLIVLNMGVVSGEDWLKTLSGLVSVWS